MLTKIKTIGLAEKLNFIGKIAIHLKYPPLNDVFVRRLTATRNKKWFFGSLLATNCFERPMHKYEYEKFSVFDRKAIQWKNSS